MVYIFLFFTWNLFVSLNLKCVFCGYHMMGWFFNLVRRSLLMRMFNLLIFNVLTTGNIGFTFPIYLFAFYRSCNSFVLLFFYYYLFYFLLIQGIKSTERWALKVCSDISGAYMYMWPSRFPGVCSRFSRPSIDMSFLRFPIYVLQSPLGWSQLISSLWAAVIFKNCSCFQQLPQQQSFLYWLNSESGQIKTSCVNRAYSGSCQTGQTVTILWG